MSIQALLAGLAGLRGAAGAGGILPQGMSLGAGIGQLGAAASAGAPALGNSLSVAPSAPPAAPPAAPNSFSLPPHLEGGGGAHGGGQAPSAPPITPGGAGAIGGGGLASLSATPAAPAFSSGSSDRTANINPYIGSTGGANAQVDRSMSPYAPGISEGAGDYFQNRPELPGPTTMDDLINSLPGAPTGTPPDYNPGYFNSPGPQQRVADNSGGVYGNSSGGASALSATGYPGGFPTGTLTPADSSAAPFSVPSYSRTVSPTSVPGSYQPAGYLGGQNEDVSNALPTLSPTSQPGFYHPPSIMNGTGGANRGVEPSPAPYLDTTGVAAEVFGGPSPTAAASPGSPSTFPARPGFPGTGFPAAPGLGTQPQPADFYPSPRPQGPASYSAGNQSSYMPGFLEAGGSSHAPIPQPRPNIGNYPARVPQPSPGAPSPYGTPRQPQARPPGGPPDSYKFFGNMPQPRPDPFSPDYQPYVQRGSGWSPYEEGFTPPLPRARPEYINPFGYYFGE